MRCTQIIGLPGDAEKFINTNCEMIPDVVCLKCGEVATYKKHMEIWKDASGAGMFDDGPKLMRYYLKDGRRVIEEIQSAPWSSGPNIFLKLVDEKTQETLFHWTDEEIEDSL